MILTEGPTQDLIFKEPPRGSIPDEPKDAVHKPKLCFQFQGTNVSKDDSDHHLKPTNPGNSSFHCRRKSSSAANRQKVSFGGDSQEIRKEPDAFQPPIKYTRQRRPTCAVIVAQPQALNAKIVQDLNLRKSATKGAKSSDPNADPLTGLSTQQIKGFKEIFDLFDYNGGGTIDAEDFDDGLRSFNIFLTKAELLESLHCLGKGDHVDFNEFLRMMTNLERVIEKIDRSKRVQGKKEPGASQNEPQPRHTMVFEALINFMKKCALKNFVISRGQLFTLDEVLKSMPSWDCPNKYQKSKASYVNHYAAGERLIGLTEKQLKEHLDSLVKATPKTKGTSSPSPYAQPLNIVMSKPKRSPTKTKISGKILLKVRHAEPLIHSSYQPNVGSDKPRRQTADHDSSTHQSKLFSQRAEHIEVKLPYLFLKPFQPFDELTANDLPAIREQVNAAFKEYRLHRRHKQVQDGMEYWTFLEPDLISSKTLRKNFQVVFSTYTDIKNSHLPLHSTDSCI